MRRDTGIQVVGMVVISEGAGKLTLRAGQRKLGLKWSDLIEYSGSRATRGGVLPRGFRRVERIDLNT